ncbi:cytochrome c oxidase assembly protein [Nocardioides hungaricus]
MSAPPLDQVEAAPRPGPGAAPAVRRGWLAVAALVVLALPALTTVLAGSSPYEETSRDQAGLLTGVLTALARAVADTAALLTVGCLVWTLVVARSRRQRRDLAVGTDASWRLVSRAAGVWLLAAAASMLLDGLDSNGMTLGRLLEPGIVGFLLSTTNYANAWLLAAACALVVWLLAGYVRRWVGTAALALLCVPAVLAPVAVGQVLVGPDHDLGGDAATLGTLAANGALGALAVGLWFGSHLDGAGRGAPRARLVAVARAGLVVAVPAGLVVTWFELAGTSPFASVTGWFLLVRLAALAVVAWGVWRLCRDRAARWPVLLVQAGILVHLAVGVAATRVAPPQFFVPTSIQQVYLGFEVSAAPSLGVLLTAWRPNLLFLALAAGGVGAYVAALRRLRSRGETWHWTRTAAWLAGWLVIVVSTSSGMGRYSAPSFAVHMGVHMSLGMLAPMLLVLGRPITLLLGTARMPERDTPPGLFDWVAVTLNSRLLRAVYHPLLVFTTYVGLYYGLYFTSLFGSLMPYHWGHQLMNLTFLLVGLVFYGLVLGVDPTPRSLPQVGRLGFLIAAMPFHSFFGVLVMNRGDVIALDFYRRLGLPWSPDLADVQRLGGTIAAFGGEIPLLFGIAVLGLQMRREDGERR